MPVKAQCASMDRIVGHERAGERRTGMVVNPEGNAGWIKTENGPVVNSVKQSVDRQVQLTARGGGC